MSDQDHSFFHWCPLRKQSRVASRHRVTTVQFEDYAQRVPQGRRPVIREFDLVFKATNREAHEMGGWIDDHVGKTFLFEHPYTGGMVRVSCEGYSITPGDGRYDTVRAKFIESPMESSL